MTLRQSAKPPRPAPSRRGLLRAGAALAGCALLSLPPRPARAAALDALTLWGPPAGPSIILTHAMSTGALAGIISEPSFRRWMNPDEMRAGLTAGRAQALILPTQVAANLYNRGLGLHLVNTMTDGLLYVVARDPALNTLEALKGRTVLVPFRNDTPDLLFNRLLRAAGLEAGRDLDLYTAGSPIEAMQLFLAGRAQAALLPEPAASAAITRGRMFGQEPKRVIDIQKLWGELTGRPPVLPQAGLAVTTAFREAHGAIIDPLHDILVRATADVIADPASAAENAAPLVDMPADILAESIPHSNFVCTRARDARPALEEMYAALAEDDPALIGGKLPDAGFYL